LVPPAVKGLTLGFIGGIIAIVALTLLIPSGSSQAETKAGRTVSRGGVVSESK
jgi:hypothetical protein